MFDRLNLPSLEPGKEILIGTYGFGKEIKIRRVKQRVGWEFYATNGGKLPKPLQGVFTTLRSVEDAVRKVRIK